MSFIVIIAALIIAVALFGTILANAKSQEKAKNNSGTDIDWDAIMDAEVQSYLPDRKINAIKRYRDLTGVGLKVGKDAIEYVIDNPDSMKNAKFSGGVVVDTDGAGVRDLIAEGRIAEAEDVYAAFMGVDEFTARDAIRDMQREETAAANLSMDDVEARARQLIADGKKIHAVKFYRQMTDYSLKEAKEAVDRIEREGY